MRSRRTCKFCASADPKGISGTMTILFFIVLIIYIILCGTLVSLVLMQEGKGGGLTGTMGASMGETFGFGGASKQVRRYTGYCATAFLIMTIILTFVAEATFRKSAYDFIGADSPAPATTVPGVAPTGEPAPATDPAPGAEAVPGTVVQEAAESEAVAPAPETPDSAPVEAAPAPAESAPEETPGV